MENRMKSIAQRLEEHASPTPSKWRELFDFLETNKSWLRHSQNIAMLMLDRMEELGMSQKQLAEKMNCSPQYISKVLRGRENLSLETLTKIENALEQVIPSDAASDFNQGLIELGAIVCVPNGEPKCEVCPVKEYCIACTEKLTTEIPVKKKAKTRKIEERTILIFKDGKRIAIRKRPAKGLLAGLYEFPNVEGKLSMDEVTEYSKTIGLMPVRVQELPEAKHIFSHIEWHMTGYEVIVDELEKTNEKGFLFIHPEEIRKEYSIPSAFEKYTGYAGIER